MIWGEAGIGKTSWAKAHFKTGEYLVISAIDDIHKFDPVKHKAIILDDCDAWLGKLSRTDAINWIDAGAERSIRARYTDTRVPKDIHRIIITNEEEGWIFENEVMEHKSIYRRMRPIHLTGSHNPNEIGGNPFKKPKKAIDADTRKANRKEAQDLRLEGLRQRRIDFPGNDLMPG